MNKPVSVSEEALVTPVLVTAEAESRASMAGPAYVVLAGISFSHFLNDTMQSLIASVYPILKDNYALDFAQIGLITLAFQFTASLLQPVVGYFTDRKAQPFLATNADEWAPKFSPDGRWIAYVSNETGRDEIYVRPPTASGARKQISTDGGVWPIWSHNGKEIFYLNDKKLMSAAIDPQSGSSGKVSMVLELKFQPVVPMFDVLPDDEHFLMSMPSEHPSPTHYNVILNWFGELQRLVPTR